MFSSVESVLLPQFVSFRFLSFSVSAKVQPHTLTHLNSLNPSALTFSSNAGPVNHLNSHSWKLLLVEINSLTRRDVTYTSVLLLLHRKVNVVRKVAEVGFTFCSVLLKPALQGLSLEAELLFHHLRPPSGSSSSNVLGHYVAEGWIHRPICLTPV